MRKCLISVVFSLLTVVCYAQWTKQDSLKLRRSLEGTEELKLNSGAVKLIEFGNATGTPRMSSEKSWMTPDETLPQSLSKPKVVLTLMPYTANTKFNWDPVYQKKIKVEKDTWRGDPFYALRHQRSYSNWAHNPMESGKRHSIDAIRASGVRYQMLGERANGQYVNTVVMGGGIPLGSSGVTLNGGTIGGLDLMAVFTKDFWNKKGRDSRERTLEVLRMYGDSTNAKINVPIEQISR